MIEGLTPIAASLERVCTSVHTLLVQMPQANIQKARNPLS
jgi:hypothetical protein